MFSITIRKGKKEELDWVTQTYQKIQFALSVFERELIAIAETDEKIRVGLGRLVQLDSEHAELGGIFVDKAYRKQGIAGQIVSFLLNHSAEYKIIYCLPFHHLEVFYQQFGFTLVTKEHLIPQEIQKKWHWCQTQYSKKVSLLFLSTKERNS